MTATVHEAGASPGWDTVYVTTGLSPQDGGPFRSVSGLAKAVTATGATTVRVVGGCRSLERWQEDRLEWLPIAVDATEGGGLRAAAQMAASICRAVAGARSAGRPALVHASGLWDHGSLAVDRARRAMAFPLVISPRGMLEPWALNHRRLKKAAALLLWQRRQLTRADMLHATSAQECDNIRRLGLRNPVCVIPNGIELPAADVGAAARVDDRGGRPPRRCVFLSRIHPKKGLPMLLEAWARVRPVDWVLEIAGNAEGGHDREIEERIRSLRLEGVRLVGEQAGDAKWRFLAGADLFVLPSHSENFGIVVAEAMTMGLPVITTHGTPWAAIEEQGLGWWVSPTVDAIERGLRQALAESSAQLADRGRRGREYALDSFAWPGIGRRMAACYAWLLGQGPQPPDVVLA